MGLPRGIRNNNPGNIRHGDNWKGLAEDQEDYSFCTFITPEFGIRAMAIILLNYKKLYKLNTVRKIISRWAPKAENNTDAYISHVCTFLGVEADDIIEHHKQLLPLITAIIIHENGENPYSLEVIELGIKMAEKKL